MSTGDRGSVSLEMAILAPVLILLVVIGIVAGRTVLAANAVADAAHAAARAASLDRDPVSARADAAQIADTTLANSGRRCIRQTTTTDTSGFAVPIGQPASVSVTVTCRISYADLSAVPGVPGGRTFSATFTSPLDQYRERS